ncbi:MAG: TlpA family protein disulfide reductase, partial [Chloroflexota bacterium]
MGEGLVKRLLLLASGVLVGAGLGLLAVFGFGVTGRNTEAKSDLQKTSEAAVLSSAPLAGSVAPDFDARNLAGDVVSLSDYRGKVVLLNFWATWCAPCEVEMPLLQDRYSQYSTEIEVLAVNYAEPEKDVKAFADKYGLSFPVLLDPNGQVNDLYHVRGYP